MLCWGKGGGRVHESSYVFNTDTGLRAERMQQNIVFFLGRPFLSSFLKSFYGKKKQLKSRFDIGFILFFSPFKCTRKIVETNCGNGMRIWVGGGGLKFGRRNITYFEDSYQTI